MWCGPLGSVVVGHIACRDSNVVNPEEFKLCKGFLFTVR